MSNKLGKIYLFPTPISEDSEIADVLPSINLEILKSIEYFVVENTRTARRFISKCKIGADINTLRFVELNEHTDSSEVESMLMPLLKGENCILMSEAGVPAVADPGSVLVAAAHVHNIEVVPLIGPSSIIMAIMCSGMNGQSFSFNGYLPIKEPEKVRAINDLARAVSAKNQTQLFIETPYRNIKLFETLKSTLQSNMMLCVASGISSKTQFIKTMSIAQWRAYKGELPINKVPTIFVLGQC